MINIPSKIPLEKMNFSYASEYELPIASWLGVHFPDSALGPIWLGPVQSCACCYSLYEFICVISPVVSGGVGSGESKAGTHDLWTCILDK